jgi:hypothetical protein
VIGISHDDVVENLDFKKLACSDEVAGDFDVRFRRHRFPARMVVLCGAPGYVQSRTGSTHANSASAVGGVLCNALTRRTPLAQPS